MSCALVHSVHFYAHDEALISRLHNIVVSSVEVGGAVLIVATPEHRAQLLDALNESHGNMVWPGESLQMFDAQETLNKFMVNDHPSDRLFRQTLSNLIANAAKAAKKPERGLTAFGEMVALLWSGGNKVGALELERMWNYLQNNHGFHLHCAYPRWILRDGEDKLMIKAICEEHSSVLGHAPRLVNSSSPV